MDTKCVGNKRKKNKGFSGGHHSEESKKRIAEANSGENNYNWKGGIATGDNYKKYRKIYDKERYLQLREKQIAARCGRKTIRKKERN